MPDDVMCCAACIMRGARMTLRFGDVGMYGDGDWYRVDAWLAGQRLMCGLLLGMHDFCFNASAAVMGLELCIVGVNDRMCEWSCGSK